MEETIELRELFVIIKKRLLMIIVLGFLGTAISGAVSFFVLTPIYQTSTQLIVSNAGDGNQITQSDISLSLNLMNTYRDILISPIILDQVVEELNADISRGQVQNAISVTNASNSQVLVLTVRFEDPAIAREIANTTARVFQENLGDILSIDNVSILAEAELRTNPVEPRPTVNMAIGAMVGIMIGVGLAFLLEYLDGKVKSEQDVKKITELPVLGVVPWMTAEDYEKEA